jgi:hypothetical protein
MVMIDGTDVLPALDDATARRLLATVAQARLRTGAMTLEPTGELGQALAEGLEVTPPEEPTPEGDIARLALRMLAEDPSTREVIVALASAPRPERFDPETTLAVTAAVLLVLQTHIRFNRDKAGKWTLTVELMPWAVMLSSALM